MTMGRKHLSNTNKNDVADTQEGAVASIATTGVVVEYSEVEKNVEE